MAKFTKNNVSDIHREFRELCNEFAEKYGIKVVDSKLTYDDNELKFTIDMRDQALNDNEFTEMANRINNEYNIDFRKGKEFSEGRKRYRITGNLNPRNSKFTIGALDLSNNREVYFTTGAVIQLLREQKGN